MLLKYRVCSEVSPVSVGGTVSWLLYNDSVSSEVSPVSVGGAVSLLLSKYRVCSEVSPDRASVETPVSDFECKYKYVHVHDAPAVKVLVSVPSSSLKKSHPVPHVATEVLAVAPSAAKVRRRNATRRLPTCPMSQWTPASRDGIGVCPVDAMGQRREAEEGSAEVRWIMSVERLARLDDAAR